MNWDEQTIKEWDELGFYYEYDSGFKQWRIFGSKIGLQKMPELLHDYASDSSNNEISEHIHIGPYNYLKIMTWNEPIISREYIGGSIDDLVRLKEIIKNKLASTSIGQIVKVSNEYSLKSTATLMFIVMADDFRPSSIEFDFPANPYTSK